MRIIFWGTPPLAVPFLEILHQDPQCSLLGAVTQQNERGLSSVAQAANRLGLPLLSPLEARALETDYFVVMAYGKIIGPKTLRAPKKGCINVHPSLLPKYRGPSPLQWAILEGQNETGITIMLMDEGMDTGSTLASDHLSISDTDTYATLQVKVMERGPALLLETMKRFDRGELTPLPQKQTEASYSKMLTREDGRINWSASDVQVERKLRAFFPWPGAWTIWNRPGKEPMRLLIKRIHLSDLKPDFSAGTATVNDGRLFVECGNGTIEVLELQPEGKRVMTAQEFIRGYQDIHGQSLE